MAWLWWIVAGVATVAVMAAALLCALRVHWRVAYDGDVATAKLTASVFFAPIVVLAEAYACKNAAKRYEARLRVLRGKEHIFNLERIVEALRQPRKARNMFVGRVLRALRRGMRLDALRVTATLGTGEAAGTALVCGALSMAAQSAIMRLVPAKKKKKCVCSVTPDFSNPVLRLELAGIVKLHCAQVIFNVFNEMRVQRGRHRKDGKRIATSH